MAPAMPLVGRGRAGAAWIVSVMGVRILGKAESLPSRFPIARASTRHEVSYKELSALQVYGAVFGDRPAGIVRHFPDVAVRVGEGPSDAAPVGGGGAADYRTP